VVRCVGETSAGKGVRSCCLKMRVGSGGWCLVEAWEKCLAVGER
jgi:hypothetical protein